MKQTADESRRRVAHARESLLDLFETVFATDADASYEVMRTRPLEDGTQKLILILPGLARCAAPKVGGTAHVLSGSGAVRCGHFEMTYRSGDRIHLRADALCEFSTSEKTFVIVDADRIAEVSPTPLVT